MAMNPGSQKAKDAAASLRWQVVSDVFVVGPATAFGCPS